MLITRASLGWVSGKYPKVWVFILHVHNSALPFPSTLVSLSSCLCGTRKPRHLLTCLGYLLKVTKYIFLLLYSTYSLHPLCKFSSYKSSDLIFFFFFFVYMSCHLLCNVDSLFNIIIISVPYTSELECLV